MNFTEIREMTVKGIGCGAVPDYRTRTDEAF